MRAIADAEKHSGNSHWTIYSGTGAIFRAKRDANDRRWYAAIFHCREGVASENRFFAGRTLREVREKIAFAFASPS